MAYRLYLVPTIGAATMVDPRRPKYFDELNWSGMDYGFQPLFLVAADLSPEADAAIIANSDVYAFPFDLTSTLNAGQANDAAAAFEMARIPAQWVNASLTWRSIVRTIAGMFQFMQRLNGVLGNEVVIPDTSQLNIQWSNVPAIYQNAILEAAQSLGYDTSFISNNTQLRAILKAFADAWGTKSFQLGLFVF